MESKSTCHCLLKFAFAFPSFIDSSAVIIIDNRQTRTALHSKLSAVCAILRTPCGIPLLGDYLARLHNSAFQLTYNFTTMDNLDVTTELGRLFSAFSEIYFITPTQFVIHCKEFLSLFHRVATSHHQQSRILDVLEVAISAFQISVLPATMSMEIFQPDLDTPESSKIMDHLMATAEKIVYSSYGCLDLHSLSFLGLTILINSE